MIWPFSRWFTDGAAMKPDKKMDGAIEENTRSAQERREAATRLRQEREGATVASNEYCAKASELVRRLQS